MALNPADGYPATPIAYATYAGDTKTQAQQYVLDIDSAMRVNYATNIVNVGLNIYPIIYVESTFDGGRYTLVVDKDTSYVKENVGAIYDQCKAISHIPLGIFSIISAYAEAPTFGQWIPALETYKSQVMLVLDKFNLLGMTGFTKAGNELILKSSIDYMGSIISRRTFTLDEFAAYARNLTDAIASNQYTAATNQVTVMKKVVNDWKLMLGESTWDKLYVVISAIWTLSQENAHELIIKSTMKPALQETNVIVSEAPQTLKDARTLLGRIVGDRVMAELVFDPKGSNTTALENIYSLSTKRDLLSQAVEAQLAGTRTSTSEEGPGSETRSAATCPHLTGRPS